MEESERINTMITDFLDFAKPKEPKLVSCDIVEVIRKTVHLIFPQARTQNIEVLEEFPRKPLHIEVDPELIQHAFTNIELNALEAMERGGVLKINVLRFSIKADGF